MTPATILGVYRRENASIVEALVRPALAVGWSTSWWALDAVAPSLARHTVGVGPGEKLPLLNEILRRRGIPQGPVLFSDDDIAFRRGDLVRLVELCGAAGLGLGQPAHVAGSHVSHGITRARARSLVRLTTFVEGGPLVVVMPAARDLVVPFPETRGMGWGVELDWMNVSRDRFRLGIVDDVAIEHLAKVAASYDDAEMRSRMRDELSELGVDDWGPLQRTLAVWRPWQRRPPWRSMGGGQQSGGDRDADPAATPQARKRRSVLGFGAARSSAAAEGRTLLVDHWYSHAVGHTIEALRRCQGYHAADPTLRVSLVLNGASPLELVRCASFVEQVFGVAYTSFGHPRGSPRAALKRIPRDWDYVVHHPAAADDGHAQFKGFRRYYDASERHFRGRVAEGFAGSEPPRYLPHQSLRLVVPEQERARALIALHGRRSIAVMPAGSAALRALYPSVTSWVRILDEVSRRLPDAVFTFVGRHRSEDGGTVSGIPKAEVERIMASRRETLDCLDRPILDQLAAVEASRLFLSPHTGFGFAAVAVGTPWLTLSGGDWPEYFFNGVPFYSVLPKAPDYPVFVHSRALPMIEADEDGEGPRTASMGARRIAEDLEELADAAVALFEGRLSYEDALAGYFPRLLEAYGGDRSMIRTFEDIDVGLV